MVGILPIMFLLISATVATLGLPNAPLSAPPNPIYYLGNGSYIWGEGQDVVFEYNCFFGNHPANEPADAHKLIADPLFNAPGSGGIGRDSLSGYRLLPESPCLNSGRLVPLNGGRDFWGASIYTGQPDRGAYEALPEKVRLTDAQRPLQAPTTSTATYFVDCEKGNDTLISRRHELQHRERFRRDWF